MDEGGTVGDRRAALVESLAAAWPTVGRAALLERILTRAETGGAGVVLTGPAGVGKSHTARVVAAHLARTGAAVEWVQGAESTGDVPFGAFSSVIPSAAGGTATPLQLLWQASTAVLERASGRRLVLVVDDAHLLDDASATLVQQLRDVPQVFLVATVRTGERMPDAVVSLWKDGDVVRLDVTALAVDEVGEILRTALGASVEEATTQRLWAATGGNPLFLHELVLAGLRSGSLGDDTGRWRWRGPLTGDGGIVHVLEERLAALADRERAALEILAIGEPLGVDLFEALVGIDVVDRLERQELVRVRRDDRREEASLFHPLYRDVLRHATPPDRAAATRETLARAVERAGGRRRGDLLRVALWRLDAPERGEPAVLQAAPAARRG
jgi:ATP/maltotriose-dependent transcriptional regulator MalT